MSGPRRSARFLLPAALTAVLGAAPAAAQSLLGEPFPATDPAAPAQPPATSRVELGFSPYGGYTAISPAQPPPVPVDTHVVAAGASLGGTLYLRPVVDDLTPLSLQPYLQRTSTVRLSLGGGGFDTTSTSNGQQFFERAELHGGIGVAVDGYVTRFLILSASFAANYFRYTDTAAPEFDKTTTRNSTLPAALGIGVRFAETRIDVGYGIAPLTSNGGDWQVPFWGGVSLAVRSVFLKFVDLSVRAALLDQGATGSAGVTVYLTREFSIFGSLYVSHGTLYLDSATAFSQVGGNLGLSSWFGRHFGTAVTYSPQWTGGPSTQVAHTFTLNLFSRL